MNISRTLSWRISSDSSCSLRNSYCSRISSSSRIPAATRRTHNKTRGRVGVVGETPSESQAAGAAGPGDRETPGGDRERDGRRRRGARERSVRGDAARAVAAVALAGLARGQGLARGEFAVERRVFGEVAHHHVAAPARETGPPHVVGVELGGEPLVQPFERREPVEHFAVARRLGAPTGDDVTPVATAFAARPQELPFFCQRLGQRFSECVGVRPGETALGPVERQNERAVVGRFTADEFLDQPSRDGFLYPPSSGCDLTAYRSALRSIYG